MIHEQKKSSFIWVILIAVTGLVIHLVTYKTLGFHRDEFLYLSLGKHLAAGYWSNPPLIGIISYLSQLIPGDPLFSTRLMPAIAGFILVILTGLISKELGGGTYAQVLSCMTISVSLLYLRAFSMLQPVPFDIFFWTVILYFLLKYINTARSAWLIWLGIFAGLGLLNKYMVFFLAAGIIIAIVITPHRRMLVRKYIWISMAIALLVFLPNIIWQYNHGFPVVKHMQELKDTQLVNVKRINIVIDQLLMFTICSVIWVAGLIWLTGKKSPKQFRVFAWTYFAVLGIFLLLKGKSYYMAGLYPFLFAAGGVSWEKTLKSVWARTGLALLIFLLSVPFIPAGIPIMSAPKLAAYFSKMPPKMGAEALLRWEDGRMHPLPQDFADMLGWDELAGIVIKASDTIEDKSRILVFGENYGQAGSVDLYGRRYGLPSAVSFSDSYLLWMPDSVSPHADLLFYINNERGYDIFPMFESVDSIGSITNPLAREYGTAVYLCRKPNQQFRDFLRTKVKSVKEYRFGKP